MGRSSDFRLADRIWIAVALLHREFPYRDDFTKDEIRRKVSESGLATIEERKKSVNPHLKQHLVANEPPSTTKKYRMLFQTRNGNLRLYHPGDPIDDGRQYHQSPKHVPRRDEIPAQYHPLLDWYEDWAQEASRVSPVDYEDDPLLRLRGSGKHIWADEHADEYVENLRREDI
jgi:hypothetical protein